MSAAFRPTIDCPTPRLPTGAQGIERVAVDDVNALLIVTFVWTISAFERPALLAQQSYTLTGGARIFPRILSAELPASPDPLNRTVVLKLDQIGDFSIYTLSVDAPDIDPFFADARLRFRLACDDPFDCREPTAPATPPPEERVAIDYLTKDYAGFRQALLDFIAVRFPDWTERSEADIGMMLLELFAATADSLSYMQDRVANEAFLSTATKRRSVAEHLALIGYRLDQGAAAHVFLQLQVNSIASLSDNEFLRVTNTPQSAAEPIIVFETLGSATLDPLHQSMPIYDWGNADCCLPQDALSTVLWGEFSGLSHGDYLLFDDGKEPSVVRLTATPQIAPAGLIGSPPWWLPPSSPPYGSPPFGSPPGGALTIVQWSAATPLAHDYCLKKTIVRGNVVLATHGETTIDETLRALTADENAALEAEIAARGPGDRQPRQRLALARAPLAYLDPSTLALANGTTRTTSTIALQVQDLPGPWIEVHTLLERGPAATAFRVEVDDAGAATIVFGDNVFGLRPPETAHVSATYRVGGGIAGNVSAATLTRDLDHRGWLDAVTNPLPATGGRDLESSVHARRIGPATFLDPIVAVTAADYQAAADAFKDDLGRPAIQRANADFRWTGSWLTVTLAVDPLDAETLSAALHDALLAYLDTRRLAGYDLELLGAMYVPIELIVSICVAPGYYAGDVEERLPRALVGPSGFFNANNFSFGDRIYVSRLYAAIANVAGVGAATITRLTRLHEIYPDARTAVNLAAGYLDVKSNEVIRLDNDRNYPEHGTLRIVIAGVGP